MQQNLIDAVSAAVRVNQDAAHPWRGANPHDINTALASMGVLMLECQQNPERTATILANCYTSYAGRSVWRNLFMRAFRGYRLVDEGCADDVLQELHAMWGKQFPFMTPSQFLDAYIPPHVITQEEIDAGWEVESDSCEEANRFFYGDKHPKEVLIQLMDPKANDPITVR